MPENSRSPVYNNQMKVFGKVVADAIAVKLADEARKLKVTPTLAIILAGEDPSSRLYVEYKIKRAKEIGVDIKFFEFERDDHEKFLKTIDRLNKDEKVHGIIIQYPIFKEWNFDEVFSKVDPKKDVDGFSEESPYKGATALAVWEMLTAFAILEGFSKAEKFLEKKKVVLLGKGKTAGGPIRDLLKSKKIKFHLIDSKTEKPEELIKNADVIISATGRKNIITGGKIKEGSFVIGVGVGKEDGKTYGDIEESSVSKKAKFYCPTIGGIGPLTVVSLLNNVVESARRG